MSLAGRWNNSMITRVSMWKQVRSPYIAVKLLKLSLMVKAHLPGFIGLTEAWKVSSRSTQVISLNTCNKKINPDDLCGWMAKKYISFQIFTWVLLTQKQAW